MLSSYQHGNNPSGYIKGGKYIVQLSDDQLLKKNLIYGVSQSVSQSCRESIFISQINLTGTYPVIFIQCVKANCQMTEDT
jgi:hypothetical protein